MFLRKREHDIEGMRENTRNRFSKKDMMQEKLIDTHIDKNKHRLAIISENDNHLSFY